MDLKEMIETIKESHPEVSDNRIIKLLNQANKEFCAETRVSEASYTVSGNTVTDKTYYTLDDSIIQIFDVYIDGERAQRISVKPDKEDEDMI
jgi:hypothetical protein